MNCSRLVLLGSSIVLGALLLLGCGESDSASGGGWTVQEGALTLERDLLVSEGESFYFGTILDVTPAADGRIYVADDEAGHIKVLAPTGTLVDTLGRKGEGPGEFQRLNQVVVRRGDSLFVLDSQRRRVSVFSPSGTFAYGIPVASGQGLPDQIMVPEGQPEIVLRRLRFPFTTESNRGRYVVRTLRPTGTAGDTLFTAVRTPMHGVQRGEVQMYLPIPFEPSLHTAMGPEDRVHVARGDSLAVASYGLGGERRHEVSIPFEPIPVTDDDLERVLKDYSEKRPMPRDKIPATKPAFEHFLVDDEGRYWFGRPTAHPDTTEWWLAWPDQKRVATTRLSDDVNLLTVRDGFAYGRTNTEKGAPALVRYRIRVSSNQ
ncbi:MAG: 6-bladed beta-propeller [Salinibacter sp.]